jgi:hypothetical protein
MSGGGDYSVGGSGGTEKTDCASLFFTTALASPVPGVVKLLKPEEVLTLEFQDQQSTVVLAMTSTRKAAGSIVSPRQARMVACMREGFKYVAIVRSVRGGSCEVGVRPA